MDCYETLGLTGVGTGLFCEDYPALKDRQIKKMRTEFPPWLGRFTSTDGGLDFVLHPEYGSGVIALRNLDDTSKYFSAEFAAVAIEELTMQPLKVFNDMRFRLRWPGIERPKFAGATNPGGKFHAWVKKYWITREYPKEFKGTNPRTGKAYDITNQFARVTAKASDNPHINELYYERNLTLPPDMAARVTHGNWDIYEGQYYPHFDKKIHVIPHAEALARVKEWHTRIISGDWGYDHPHCFHWHAKDERNHVITFDEVCERQVHETEVGQNITQCEAKYHKLSRLQAFVFVWDAGKLSPRSEKGQPKSISTLLTEGLGPNIPRPHPADSSPGVRLIRARLMSQVIKAKTWLISDRCTKLIESLPEMVRDVDHPEEMAKIDWTPSNVGDDPVDSAGTGLQWMVGSTSKPDSVKLEEQLQAVRERFVARVEVGKPGEDWAAKFGGRTAQRKPWKK